MRSVDRSGSGQLAVEVEGLDRALASAPAGGRAGAKIRFPARFLLVAAMNPCPCGYWKTGLRECKCSDVDVARYRARISGPLLDRIDIHVDVPSIDVGELRATGNEETSATMRRRSPATNHATAPT